MITMDLRAHWTFSGKLVFGDALDEDAPIVEIKFCNEASQLSPEDKIKLVQDLISNIIK